MQELPPALLICEALSDRILSLIRCDPREWGGLATTIGQATFPYRSNFHSFGEFQNQPSIPLLRDPIGFIHRRHKRRSWQRRRRRLHDAESIARSPRYSRIKQKSRRQMPAERKQKRRGRGESETFRCVRFQTQACRVGTIVCVLMPTSSRFEY